MTTTDTTHLNALELRLSHEREYLRAAKTDAERELRSVWIAQIEKEIAHEKTFIGGDMLATEISDADLLAELAGDE